MARFGRAYPMSLAVKRGSPSSVTFDAVGAGADLNGQTLSPGTITWSQTSAAGAYVVVDVFAASNANAGITSITATYGATSMTQAATVRPGNLNYGLQAQFRLVAVPGGAQTVSVTAAAASGAVNSLVGNSVSYLNVGSASTPTTTFQDGVTALSQSATGVSRGIVHQAFAGFTTVSAQSLSSYNQTQRYLHNAVSGTDSCLVIGDSTTVGAVTFTATASPAIVAGGIAVVLT
jgi:hypothetical protein